MSDVQLVFGHWTMTQLAVARRIAVEVMQTYGDLTGDEYERFLKNPWNDHCAVQAALRAMPRFYTPSEAELQAAFVAYGAEGRLVVNRDAMRKALEEAAKVRNTEALKP